MSRCDVVEIWKMIAQKWILSTVFYGDKQWVLFQAEVFELEADIDDDGKSNSEFNKLSTPHHYKFN